MNLYALLQRRVANDNPIRIGRIGAGKFASMFLAQARRTPGFHILAIADLNIERAKQSLRRTGWADEQFAATNFYEARRQRATFLTQDSVALIRESGVEVIIDATGDPAAGVLHALLCFQHGRHIVMVNVEADALCGPLLARKAVQSDVVYSLAYGDQPALICELVDWARGAGFDVVAAGKGTKYLPVYHQSTPETVWGHYGFSPEQVAQGDFNAQMFNSFLDGTKSGIEMAAVANATGLTPAPDGLVFPPAGVDELAQVCRPKSAGGALHHAGQVEVVSSLRRDGAPVERDLRWGVYVTFEAASDYVARCFKEYGLVTDESGRYTAMYKPYHLIGLELGISVLSAVLRREPTGAANDFRGDVVATAKRDLKAGELLDGEGGQTVWGKLMPARDSLAVGGLPIGLAHKVKLKHNVPAGQPLKWMDVEIDQQALAVKLRREMESMFRLEQTRAAE